MGASPKRGRSPFAREKRLVDELHHFIAPVTVGGGTSGLPSSGLTPFELLDHRRFGNGTTFARYRTRTPS